MGGGNIMRRIFVFLLVLAAIGSWASDRPVRLWGYGNWFEVESKEWKGEKPMIQTFNEWSQKKFGVTWEYAGPVPKGQSWSQALAAYVAAKGMPDVIIGGTGGSAGAAWSTETTNAFLDFVKNGKLADLTKYFNDKKNYPVLYEADKDYLRTYQVNGKMYALPGPGWHVLRSDPYSGRPYWIIRYDLMKKYGTPKTMAELYDFLKKVKQDKPTDIQGKPVIPMVIGVPSDWPGSFDGILGQAFGAGWNITKGGKLMPGWATEEFGTALAWVNQIAREGLLDTEVFSDSGDLMTTRLRAGAYGVGLGASVAEYRDRFLNPTMKKLEDRNSDYARELVSKQAVMLVPPVADKPGRLNNSIAAPTMISKDCPNIAGVMKFSEFLLTFEGMVMFMAGAGFLGENWEYVDYPDGPIYWQNKGKEPGNRDLNVTFPWGSVINALGSITYRTSASYYETMYYNKFVIYQRMAQWGIKVGSHNNDDATALEWSKDYAAAVNPLASPIPSWIQFKYITPQEELSANVAVQQRLNEWMPKVILAKTQGEFIDLYGQMMQALVACGNWKKIYMNRQNEYEAWLKAMKFDDRKGMPTNRPSRWWIDAVGEFAFPY